MIRKNIRTLFALGAACIHFIITDVYAKWPETSEQQAEVNYYLQVKKGIPLSSFDYFYCDKNQNATTAHFHDERSYSSTSVTNLALPGGAEHIVHQFGKELLIIPGNTFQTRMVCRAEPQKQKLFRTVVVPGSRLLEKETEEASNLFSRILKLLDLYQTNELENVLRQEFWQEIVRISDEMMAASAGAGDGKGGAGTGSPGSEGSTHDPSWKSPFPGVGGHGGDDEDGNDDDDSSHGGNSLFESLLVPAKTGGGFSEDFGGFWFPNSKPKPDDKKKNRKPKKRYVAVVPSSDSPDSSPDTIEVTANPVIENLTVIQFALLVGGFEVNADLQEQLLHLDQLSIAELEQLAEGFSATINNIDSLIEHETIQVPGISHQQLVQILLKIESLIRELAGIRDAQNDPDISRNLWRIRDNLRELVGGRLMATILGSNQVTVSGDAGQHELLVRVLLEADTDELPESDEEVDMEELQDLIDEYIRRVRDGITGEELIRALVAKIEAIQRQIDRREASLGRADGSWFRALQNRLDTLRLELAAAEQSLANVVDNYFQTPDLFADDVTAGVMSEPEDKGGKEDGSKGKGGGAKPNPPPPGGGTPPQGHGSQPPPSQQPPGDEERDDSDDSGHGNGGGARAFEGWEESESKRDMAVWFAEQLREMSLRDTKEEQAGALFFKFESKPEIRNEIIRRIRALFTNEYPRLIPTLPPEGETKLDGYVKAILSVMRGVALANILFDLADREQLEEIRKMYNTYVKGLMGQSIRRSDPIEFAESRGWGVSFHHNGMDWSYDPSTGQHVVSDALSQLELSQMLRMDGDGFIHFTQEERERHSRAFLQHSNSGRTPVQFSYVRISERTGRPVITRSYDLHRFMDLRARMAEVFPTGSDIRGKKNPDADINSLVVQTSQRGGIEDSIQLILNQHPDAAAILYWLFEPNNSTIPLSYMVFGTPDTEGLLQQRRLPLLNPRSRDQRDLSSQNCEVTVYSNGRMSVHYTVTYDQVSRDNRATNLPEHYSAEFSMELVLDFDISQPQGVSLLNSQFIYKGQIDYEEQGRLETAMAEEQEEQDRKTIEGMRRVAEDIKKYVERYEAQKVTVTNHKSAAVWRRYAANALKHALSSYYSLLTSIRSRNLAQYREYARARTDFDKFMKSHKLHGRLMAAMADFLRLETRTYTELSSGATKQCLELQGILDEAGRSDLSYEDVYEQFEEHRKLVQDALVKLQQIKENLEARPMMTYSAMVNIHGQVDVLSRELDELDAMYNDRTQGLFINRRNLSRAGAEVEIFDLFEPANALISAARLYVAELHVELDGREKAFESGWASANANEILKSGAGKKAKKEKKPKEGKSKSISSLAIHQIGTSPVGGSGNRRRSRWDIRRLFDSGNTPPSGTQSSSGSLGNLLEVSETRELEPSALTHRGRYQRRMSTETTTASTVAPHHNTLRAARSYNDVRRNNVRQVTPSTPFTLSNSGVSSPDTSLALYGYDAGNLSPEYHAGVGGLTLGPPVLVGTGGSSSSSSHSSSQGLNSMGSSNSMPTSRSPLVQPNVHGRSLSDDLQRTVIIPMNSLRYRPSQMANVMDTINSPVGSPRRFGQDGQFTLPLTSDGDGQSSLEFPHPRQRDYRRSQSSDATGYGGYGARTTPAVIMSPEDMSHSEVHGPLWQSASHLEWLIHNNVPSNAMASAVFKQLQRKGMNASDFRERLSPEASYDDYDHFDEYDGWQAVQTYIGEYLRARHSLFDLASQLFEILGFEFRRNLERLYNQARVSQLQVRPHRGDRGTTSPRNYH